MAHEASSNQYYTKYLVEKMSLAHNKTIIYYDLNRGVEMTEKILAQLIVIGTHKLYQEPKTISISSLIGDFITVLIAFTSDEYLNLFEVYDKLTELNFKLEKVELTKGQLENKCKIIWQKYYSKISGLSENFDECIESLIIIGLSSLLLIDPQIQNTDPIVNWFKNKWYNLAKLLHVEMSINITNEFNWTTCMILNVFLSNFDSVRKAIFNLIRSSAKYYPSIVLKPAMNYLIKRMSWNDVRNFELIEKLIFNQNPELQLLTELTAELDAWNEATTLLSSLSEEDKSFVKILVSKDQWDCLNLDKIKYLLLSAQVIQNLDDDPEQKIDSLAESMSMQFFLTKIADFVTIKRRCV